MAKELSPEEKLDLITSQLQETLKPELLRDIVVNQKRPLSIYWGTLLVHLEFHVPQC